MPGHGFLRVSAAVPEMRVADCRFNAGRIVSMLHQAEAGSVRVIVFPELALTGYTCADLFHHATLTNDALEGLRHVVEATRAAFTGIAVVGVPLVVDDQVFNCAAVLHGGTVLGVVPKSFLPNYKEFYEARWFAPAATARSASVRLFDHDVPFGTDLLFPHRTSKH